MALLCFSSLFASPPSELWLLHFWEKELKPCDRLIFYDQLRYRANLSRLYFWALEGIWYHRFSPFVEIGPGYRLGWAEVDRKMTQTHLPYLVLLATVHNAAGAFSTRNRAEVFIVEGQGARFAYRNRLQWELPIFCKKWRPFISDELFWREKEGWRENRLITGVDFFLTREFTFSPCFLFRSEKIREEKRWDHFKGLYVATTYHF